jgi:adenosine deaminase
MPSLGLRIHPNTDDPTLHHVDPTRAWGMMVRDFGFTIDDLRGFMLNGIAGAWIPPEQRTRWLSGWAAEFDALRARHQPDAHL